MKRVGVLLCVAAILVAGVSFLMGCNEAKADGVRHLYVISSTDRTVMIHDEVPSYWLMSLDGGGVVGDHRGFGPHDSRFYAGANMVFITVNDLGLQAGDVFTSFSPVARREK